MSIHMSHWIFADELSTNRVSGAAALSTTP